MPFQISELIIRVPVYSPEDAVAAADPPSTCRHGGTTCMPPDTPTTCRKGGTTCQPNVTNCRRGGTTCRPDNPTACRHGGTTCKPGNASQSVAQDKTELDAVLAQLRSAMAETVDDVDLISV